MRLSGWFGLSRLWFVCVFVRMLCFELLLLFFGEVRVRKRRNVLSLEGNDAACGLERLEAVRRQPVVDSGVLFLANEEFEKEKGGYESDAAEEDEDVLCDAEGGPSARDADGKKRKRKVAEKNRESKYVLLLYLLYI